MEKFEPFDIKYTVKNKTELKVLWQVFNQSCRDFAKSANNGKRCEDDRNITADEANFVFPIWKQLETRRKQMNKEQEPERSVANPMNSELNPDKI